MAEKWRQKFKYIENKKSFQDEIKSIFHHFWRTIIEGNNKIFWEGENPTLPQGQDFTKMLWIFFLVKT